MTRPAFVLTLLGLVLTQAPEVLAQGTSLKGRIVWDDKEVPPPEKLDELIKKSPDKDVCLMAGSVYAQRWVVNPKNKGLKWTFVWLANEDPKDKSPLPVPASIKMDKQVVIDQPLCMFIPHALALREGQTLVVKNTAKIPHNFKYTGNPVLGIAGNFTMPPGSEVPLKGLKADRLPIKMECNIHPWMNGWIRVFDHPYYAITDEDGAFEIKNVPAGKWRLVVWHGTGGWRGGAAGRYGSPITITAGKANDAGNLPYTPPEE